MTQYRHMPPGSRIGDVWDRFCDEVSRNRIYGFSVDTIPSQEDVTAALRAGYLHDAMPEYMQRAAAIDADLPMTQAALADQCETVHDEWYHACNPPGEWKRRKLPHPLMPIIDMYMRTERVVTPVRRDDAIAPIFDELRDMNSADAELPNVTGRHSTGGMRIPLPGFETDSVVIRPPILAVHDYLGDQYGRPRRYRAAPMTLRIFYEVLMSVPLHERERVSNLRISLREIRDWLYPQREHQRQSTYQPSKHFSLIERSLGEIHNMRFWVTPRGETAPVPWQPINARAFPGPDLDSRARFEVLLPPGSDRGALVDRRVMREVGARSATEFRAYLSLCYTWDRYGLSRRGKRLIRSTRPVVARDDSGFILNRQGEKILVRGAPIKTWTAGTPLDDDGRPTSLGAARRELNPDALNRYPVMTDEDLLMLCYHDGENEALSSSARRDRRRAARKTIRKLADSGHCIIVEGQTSTDGLRHGWKVLPP